MTSDAPPDAAAPRARRRIGRWLGLAAGIMVGARLALPAVLERALPWAVERQLGLPARIGNVDLSLLRGAVAVEDLTVGRRAEVGRDGPIDPERALVRWRRLRVDLGWLDLLGRRLRLQEVVLEAPSVRLEQEPDGRVDPLGSGAEPEPEAVPVAEAEPSEPVRRWPVHLDRLALRGLDVRLSDPGGSDLARLGLEELVLSELGFDGERIALGDVSLTRPSVRVDRDYALGGAPEAAAPSRAPEARGASAAPLPAYRVETIDVDSGDLVLETEAGPVRVSVHLRASAVAAEAGHAFPIELEVGIEDGGLELDGQLGLVPPAYRGRVTWRDLPVPPFSVIARPEILPWFRSCRAAGDLEVEAQLGATAEQPVPGVRLAGSARIDGFSFADPNTDEVAVEWSELELAVREAFLPLGAGPDGVRPASRLALGRVGVVRPVLHYTRPPGALAELLAELGAKDAGEAAPAEPAAAPPSEAAASPPLDAVIDAVDVSGGTLRFRDRTVSPAHETTVRDLSLAARDVRWPELDAERLRVRGVAPRNAPFRLEGSLDGGSGELAVALERLALTPFDPYARTSGYRVARGEGTLRSKLRIRAARYESRSDLVLHDLRIDTQQAGDFEGRFGVPIDLALALLRGPNGDIELPVPLAWDAGALRIGFREILAGALRDAVVGALSSPLKMVGAVLPKAGKGEVSLAPLASVPGAAELAPGENERVEGLAALLRSRPGLALLLVGRAGRADRPELAERLLAELAAADRPLPEVEDAGFFANRRVVGALRRRAEGEDVELEPSDQALLLRYVQAIEVPAQAFLDLARRRAERVRADLVAAGAPAGAVAIGDPADGEPGVATELRAG